MKHIALCLALSAFLPACSSMEDMKMPADAAMDGMDMDAMDMGTTDGPAAETHPDGGMAAPTVTAVNKMMGFLHVQWKNNSSSCDSVEGERKTDTEPYKVVFTVPGTVDNKMETTASMDMTYTYRLRCKMGAGYSMYSNEMGNNPVK